MVMSKEARNDIAALLPRGEFTAVHIRRARRFTECSGLHYGRGGIICSLAAAVALDRAVFLLAGRNNVHCVVNIRHNDMLKRIGGDGRSTVLGGKRRLRFQIPVQLILPYPVVFALSLRRVGAGVKEPEVYDRRFAVGTVDEQIIVAYARHVARRREASGVTLVVFHLGFLADAAFVVMVAEDDGKLQAALGYRLQNRVQRFLRAFNALAS